MKLRPFLILMLFVVSTGILVWIYIATTRPQPPPAPRAATLTDLDACGRRKHIKSVQYDHFAEIASDEHIADAERLFHALAHAERVQENNCARAILRLGGNYAPPTKVSVFHGTTDNNLERSIAYERQLLNSTVSAEIDRAVASGNRYAARVMIWARAGDLQHVILMERSRRGETRMTAFYLVCPVCGNLYSSDYTAPHCPHCLTDGRRFVRFE